MRQFQKRLDNPTITVVPESLDDLHRVGVPRRSLTVPPRRIFDAALINLSIGAYSVKIYPVCYTFMDVRRRQVNQGRWTHQ